jgi:hypothetical protein
MKKQAFFLFLVFILASSHSNAQTYISENVNVNTTWSSNGSPYVIENDVIISEGVTLEIDAGVIIKFHTRGASQSNFIERKIKVEGSIEANGTPEAPITFTSLRDDAVGGDTNNDGSSTVPGIGDWGGIELTASSSGASFQHCDFRYGGLVEQYSWDNDKTYGAIRVEALDAVIKNCNLINNKKGIVSSVQSVNVLIDSCRFVQNEIGVTIETGTIAFLNSSFSENDISVENESPQNINAQQNWWGFERYLEIIEAAPNTNFDFIYDQFDNEAYGIVDISNPIPPPPGIRSIEPGTAILAEGTVNPLITGYPFESDAEVFFRKNENEVLVPTSFEVSNAVRIELSLNLINAEPGVYDLLVVNNPGDTLLLENGFKILDAEVMPFNEWIDFEVANGDAFASGVVVPDVDQLFVFLKKSTRVGYANTWSGNLNLSRGSTDIALENDAENNILGGSSNDIDFHQLNPESGYYSFEIETTNEQGEGQIMFTDAPPSLELGSWGIGEILRPYGYDWKKVEVPEGLDTLFIRTEGFGKWSTIEVFFEHLSAESENKWLFDNWGAGYSITGAIAAPEPGVYYIRYKDSAVLQADASGNLYTDQENQHREYLIQVAGEVIPPNDPNLRITHVSSSEVGQERVTIDIQGTGFNPEDEIRLVKEGITVATMNSLLFQEGRTWRACFDLTVAEEGEWELEIENTQMEIAQAPYPIVTAP